MDENRNITDETLEHILEIISDFEIYLYEEGYSNELIEERINLLHNIIKASKSDYGLINYLITVTSWWDETFKIFIKKFLYPLFINVYKVEIDKDPKKLLLLIANYLFTYNDTFLSEPFKLLREYARDLVLLNSTDPSGHYTPVFNEGEDISVAILSIKDASSLKDILINPTHEIRIMGYIDKIRCNRINDRKEIMPKDIVPLFFAIKELALIKLEYQRSFDMISHLRDFISKLAITIRRLDNKDISQWNPEHRGCSKNARIEVDIHKSNIRRILT